MRMVHFRWGDLFTAFIILLLAGALIEAWSWDLRASIIILSLGGVGLVLAIAQLVADLRRHPAEAAARPTYEIRSTDEADSKLGRRSLEMWAWLVGLVLAIPIVGLPVALVTFVFVYAKVYGAGWMLATFLAGLVGAFTFGIYDRLMYVYWPESLLGKWFPSF